MFITMLVLKTLKLLYEFYLSDLFKNILNNHLNYLNK